jgi:pimeloyl-ACP methyl ester carboxylesterase
MRAAADRPALAGGNTAAESGGPAAAATASTTAGVIEAGEGPLVVLLHGQPGEGRDWNLVTAGLSQSFRVIAPDRPGWGGGPEEAVGLLDNADWLDEQLRSLAGDERAVVVGHSFGGGVAIALAMRHRARVRALVLVGSVGHHQALSGLDRLLAKPVVGEGIVRAGIVGARRVTRVLARRLARIDRASEVVRRAEQLSMYRVLSGAEPIAANAWRSFIVEQRALVNETPHLEAALSSISVPTAVVSGARDRVVPVTASRGLAELIPGAEMITLARAGHLVPVEMPGELVAIIARYDRLAAR